MKLLLGKLLVAGAVLMAQAPLAMAADLTVRIAVLDVEREDPLPISMLDLPPEDLGFAGGRVATNDNRTTGRFLGHKYETEYVSVAPDEMTAKLDELIEAGTSLFVTMARAEDLLALSDHAGERDVLIVNAQAEDDRLRTEDCRSNVVHVAHSRAMKADALAQFLLSKRWRKWFLVHGSNPDDKLWADALRRSAGKFGVRIVEEREYEDSGGARRSDTGHVIVQRQMPIFTQRAKDHDVLVAADESNVFAAYLPYHTWDARPVAGSAGLQPVGWHPALEAWGGTQFQTRFDKEAKRTPHSIDYMVWLSLRAIGEAVIRTDSSDAETLRSYMTGENFELAAFKGVPVSFRSWNQQLRSPVLLANDKLVVTASPQDEFLHKRTRLDTLGFDEPESKCRLNQ